MKKYIDKTALMKTVNTGMNAIEVMQAIINAPTADVEEVRHGEWIHGEEVAREYIGNHLVGIFYDRWTCSECGYVVGDHKYSKINYNYCPNCCARMDGGVNDAAD